MTNPIEGGAADGNDASDRRCKSSYENEGLGLDDATHEEEEERNVASLLVRKKRCQPKLFRSKDAPPSLGTVPALPKKEEERIES